ncbi:cytochrome c oxidase subunit 3 family protein [Solimonas terrae]|uniref:Cytochrome c oxidase subunit 3 family protein n=2 Tax=Solimonas terrae TaxID=1396819 RepID=A0A6M2BRP1_9GAMM|nr:cytochrome c oxidase subunit 3 [Solimonas terrae]NGY05000.1 cytochrome c oxidase subunit 3 family protein [Solimonas terrae]
MWFFVIGDLFIFAIYFVLYVVYRQQQHALFLSSEQHLNQGIGAINTVVLLTSSLFVALGTQTARLGKARDAMRLFVFAAATGALFPILKLVEWLPELGAGLTPGHNLFFMFYYVMAGLHLCHVMLGLVIMCFVIRDLRISKAPDMKFIEAGATYWHMVDLLWLVLFALFYLMR